MKKLFIFSILIFSKFSLASEYIGPDLVYGSSSPNKIGSAPQGPKASRENIKADVVFENGETEAKKNSDS